MGPHRRLLRASLLVGLLVLGLFLVGLTGPETRHWSYAGDGSAAAMAISAGGGRFATLSGGATPDRLHAFDADHILWAKVVEGATAVAVAEDGRVAVGKRSGGIALFAADGTEAPGHALEGRVEQVRMDHAGGTVAAVARGVRPALTVFGASSGRDLLELPLDGTPLIDLSGDGSVLVAAAAQKTASRLYLYSLAGGAATSLMTAVVPGPIVAADVSDDGRHILAVTTRAAWLFARGHERPIGVVPDTLGASEERYRAGALAGDGQSFLLLGADGRTVHHHKWSEAMPRWTWDAGRPVAGIATGADGEIAVVVPRDGPIVVLSLKAGRPLRQVALEDVMRAWALSADGSALVAADAGGRVHRAETAPGGALGLLPHAVVATLYALPPTLPAIGILLIAVVLARHALAPFWRSLWGRRDEAAADRAEPAVVYRLDDPPDWARRLAHDVRLEGLTVRAHGRRLLEGVDLSLPAGRLTVVLGGSGEGKTTLLGALSGSRRVTGTIRVGARRVHPDSAAWHRLVGHVAQRPALYDGLTARENLQAFAGPYGIPPAVARSRADRLLSLVGLAHASDRPVARLSGGERQRVSIAAALMPGPAVILLDEPTSGLDAFTRRQVWDLLVGIRDACGTTLVVSSHALDEAERADHVVVLEQGHVLAAGPPEVLVQASTGRFEDAFLGLLCAARKAGAGVRAPAGASPGRECGGLAERLRRALVRARGA